MFNVFSHFYLIIALWSHSTIRGQDITKFWPPPTLEWTIVDILNNTYQVSNEQAWTFYWPLSLRGVSEGGGGHFLEQ